MISDETIFGNVFFEPLAKLAAHGDVSPTEGVDFTVERSDRYLAVAVKSGPNWGNADQHKRQSTNFDALRKRLLPGEASAGGPWMSEGMRQVAVFVNGRDETTSDDLVTAGLAPSPKLASQKLTRLHGKGLIDHPRYGVYAPLPTTAKETSA